jgi:phospholipid transport system substrate-binding protein
MHIKGKILFVYHWLIISLVFIYIALSPLYGNTEQSGAAEVIKKFNATLIESMKRAGELGYSGRYKLLEPVIKDIFALSFMADKSIGRYWKTLKKEEQNLLIETYTNWTIATYAGRFDDYSGERFELISESEPVRGTVTVVSRLIESKDKEIDFYYLLRKMEGKWCIVDIHISGVSQLALTRSQFVSVFKSDGFNGLISMLKNKIKNFKKEKD